MKQGLLFTDSLRLASKYHCKVGDVVDILNHFITESNEVGIHWDLLDLGTQDYSSFFEETLDWTSYQSILDDFCYGTGLNSDSSYSLFIIGGDDVIPMPKVRNNAVPNPSQKEREAFLEADFLYCYEGKDIFMDEDGYVNKDKVFSVTPRWNVGRLPLEDGDMPTTIQSDLLSYFNRSVIEYKRNGCKGIKVSNALMTSCFDTKTSAREVVKNIPTPELPESTYTYKNIIESPELDIKSAEDAYEYHQVLRNADLLLFILHGSSQKGHNKYYGHRGNEFTDAFDFTCLEESSARVINPVCCWGARYIGFSRDDSMLLSAIYGKTLLFTGSCRSVYGRFRGTFNHLFPIGYGEIFLKIYTNYLLQGYDAGYANLKAKLDYFTNYSALDSADRAFGTIMMFNLYGNPLLNIEPIMRRGPVFISDGTETFLPQRLISTYKAVYSLSPGNKAIAQDVRALVDSSLLDIKSNIEKYLYQKLGLSSYVLTEIFQRPNHTSFDYLMCYTALNSDGIENSIMFETDSNGTIIDVIYEY